MTTFSNIGYHILTQKFLRYPPLNIGTIGRINSKINICLYIWTSLVQNESLQISFCFGPNTINPAWATHDPPEVYQINWRSWIPYPPSEIGSFSWPQPAK